MLRIYLHWLGGQPLLFRPRVVLVLSLVVPDTLSGNWLASSSTEFECMALTVSVTHSHSSSTYHSRLFSVGVLDPGMMNVTWHLDITSPFNIISGYSCRRGVGSCS